MSNSIECQDKLLNGVCTKGRDCSICNRNNATDGLDINSQEYVPKNRSKKTEENGKLNLNLQAKECVPSRPLNIQNVEYIEEDDDGNDEVNQEEFDMIENDIINDEILNEMGEIDDSEDGEKWYPKYKDCECCKGYVYNCKGDVCQSLGQCYCKMKDDCEED